MQLTNKEEKYRTAINVKLVTCARFELQVTQSTRTCCLALTKAASNH